MGLISNLVRHGRSPFFRKLLECFYFLAEIGSYFHRSDLVHPILGQIDLYRLDHILDCLPNSRRTSVLLTSYSLFWHDSLWPKTWIKGRKTNGGSPSPRLSSLFGRIVARGRPSTLAPFVLFNVYVGGAKWIANDFDLGFVVWHWYVFLLNVVQVLSKLKLAGGCVGSEDSSRI